MKKEKENGKKVKKKKKKRTKRTLNQPEKLNHSKPVRSPPFSHFVTCYTHRSKVTHVCSSHDPSKQGTFDLRRFFTSSSFKQLISDRRPVLIKKKKLISKAQRK